jgi:hypothetical protein
MRLLFCSYVSTVAKRRQLLAWDASPRENSRSVRSREATAVVTQVIAVNANVFANLYVGNCRRFATFASGVDCHLGLASQASNCHRFAIKINTVQLVNTCSGIGASRPVLSMNSIA